MLFLVWAGSEFRATRDIDLLGTGSGDHDAIQVAIAAICAIDYPQDGLRFDAASIRRGGVGPRLVVDL